MSRKKEVTLRDKQVNNYPKAKPKMVVISFPIGVGSDWIEQKRVSSLMKDGRTASPFIQETLQEMSIGYKNYEGQQKGVDGQDANGTVEVRGLAKTGVKFQYSGDIGSGRSCDAEKLGGSLSRTDTYYISDLTDAPTIHVYRVPAYIVNNWFEEGNLTVSGLSHDKFMALVERDFDLSYRTINPPKKARTRSSKKKAA